MVNHGEQSRLRTVVNTAVDGVILIDAQGTILMFNPACERLFGYPVDEVIGQNVKILMPTPYQEEHDRYLENYHNTGERKIIGIGREVVGLRKDGTTFPMDLSVGDAPEEDGKVFVGVIHDLTDRKKTEAQLIQAQKMETVGQLAGGIAHDFNNLLTVILGNADILSASLKVRPDLKEACDAVINAGERGAELTQRLLAFSRRQALKPVIFDPNKLIQSMLPLLQRILREDIEVKIKLSDNISSTKADPAQLESAILNMALNAQDAMPNGGCLTFETAPAYLDDAYVDKYPEVKAGQYILIMITDNGVGMSPEVCARAFEPFFTTKEVGKGSGLGLSMVYGFIKQSNGHIALYSEQMLGTNIRLYLPATNTPSEYVVAGIEDKEIVPYGDATILIVEDDPFVRNYAITSLQNLGYQVVAAENGSEALEKLKEGIIPDLLFTDIVMPGGVNGWSLAEQAVKICPTMKVLFTSGYPLETLESSGFLKPNTQILNKPYRKVELANRFHDILKS